ncbi:TPA: TetR/AcrR family transcriptional regulator [Pseudomonas aeruginosa]|uniref:TetR family transcriptional regulator n=2 Tax=Pseudomonas aeruginosa group TaxID=136841 RepID=A0A7M3B4P1_PSEAI|nr:MULTISPECIES: TetR/AcrR family transcriptional regulator [Pseudomonas]KEA17200.1 hypothetical protein BH78_29690 [Pseudomonas aeruginosa C1913C]AVN42066.1 TetR/AcrR family transcriptional regulator [Pseudomonas aeruginosa]AVZ19003.1 TetR/AcrR family transcriptional regulator [Pseudomonas aeruginosa]AXL83031.1 hypothetical protein Y89_2514 [Pseudomonas aeruginosa]AXO28470.1 hypothetical protein Ysp71_2519 [Pseudomonas aeruginosa]
MNMPTATCSLLPMTGKVPSSVDHASPHQLVRQVALTLFSELGFHNVSLRKLASALGMQPGSLYHHIEGKQELLFELIDEYETDLLDAIKIDLPTGGSPDHKLSAYIHSYFSFNASNLQRCSIAQLEFRNLNQNQQKVIEATRAEYASLLDGIIQYGIRTQSFSPIFPQAITHLILSMLTEMSKQAKSSAALTFEDATALLQEAALRILHT